MALMPPVSPETKAAAEDLPGLEDILDHGASSRYDLLTL